MNLKPETLENGKLYKGKILYLDVIRFIACFAVVFYHFTVAIPQKALNLGVWGRVGVGMFFMISGAALTNGYYGGLKIKEFYKKRFLSIYIPFYIAYICAFAVLFVRGSFHSPVSAPKWTFIFTLSGLDGYMPCLGKPSFYILGEWFLPVIIFIYLIFPLWRAIFIKAPTVTLITVFALRVLLIAGIIPSPVALCFNVIPAVSYFTLGAYLLLLLKKFEGKRLYVLMAIIGALSLAAGVYINHYLYKVDTGEIFSTLGVYLICSVAAKLITLRFLLKPILWISSVSYEIFLLHHVIIFIICPYISANLTKITFVFGWVFTCAVILVCAFLLNRTSVFVRKKILKQ